MSISNNAPKTVARDQLDRRSVLQGVTLGAGSLLFAPLGGKLKTGQFLSYPVKAQAAGRDGGNQTFGTAYGTNPYTNALYATLLTAVGKPCDAFNRPASSSDAKEVHAPLPELLNA